MPPSLDHPTSFTENIEARLSIGFGVVVVVVVLIVAAAINNSLKLVATSDWVNHTHAVIVETDAILSALHSAQSAQRTYLITGESRDQGAYRTAFGEMKAHLDVAMALTAENPDEHALLARLEPFLAARVEFARETVQAREKGLDAARTLLISDKSLESMNEIVKLVTQLTARENVLLLGQEQAAHEHERTTRWILFAGLGLDLVLLSFLFWIVRLDLAVRRRAAAALAAANASLESRVRDRTAELAASVESLEVENLERRWAQEASQRLNRHNELVINSISEGVLVISRRTSILRINPAVVHFSGYSDKELFGKAIEEIIHLEPRTEDDGRSHRDVLLLSMKEGSTLLALKAVLHCKNGATKRVLYSSHPVRDKDKVVGTVVTILPGGN
jgi:PAS domain S-box-containing protein